MVGYIKFLITSTDNQLHDLQIKSKEVHLGWRLHT